MAAPAPRVAARAAARPSAEAAQEVRGRQSRLERAHLPADLLDMARQRGDLGLKRIDTRAKAAVCATEGGTLRQHGTGLCPDEGSSVPTIAWVLIFSRAGRGGRQLNRRLAL
jgi:hypothetical protein